MNKCKDCKWWGVVDRKQEISGHFDIVAPYDPDTYKPMDLPFKVQYCLCPKVLFCERPLESDGACVADGSGYMAALLTAEDFGCVLFEPKENV